MTYTQTELRAQARTRLRVRQSAQPTERQIHTAVLDNLKLRAADGVLYWHTPNGGARNKAEAARLKQMGTLAGVGDLLLLDRSGRFFSLELKAASGRVSEAQLAWQANVNASGGFAAIAHGLDEAIRILETWKLIRPSCGRGQ
jgi:VRR-NUC domain